MIFHVEVPFPGLIEKLNGIAQKKGRFPAFRSHRGWPWMLGLDAAYDVNALDRPQFIQKDDTVAGINSVSHLYIQNRYNRGATVMINSTFENKKNITDYMTFKAITSKGKGYDENWNEVDLLYGDGNKGPSQVSIGGQGGSDFCHMIFKNMALYMNKVFSKDECIKAYNYLQTIKAK